MDAKDKTTRTPLLEAITSDHVEVARYLVQCGASVYHVVSVLLAPNPPPVGPRTHLHMKGGGGGVGEGA